MKIDYDIIDNLICLHISETKSAMSHLCKDFPKNTQEYEKIGDLKIQALNDLREDLKLRINCIKILKEIKEFKQNEHN
jgi:hypothetical protein